jgi:hypothetical protein
MLPGGLAVRVVDSYIAGSGLLQAAILGLVTVAKVSGGGEVAWVRSEGRKPYFRGTITSLTYEFAPR